MACDDRIEHNLSPFIQSTSDVSIPMSGTILGLDSLPCMFFNTITVSVEVLCVCFCFSVPESDFISTQPDQ